MKLSEISKAAADRLNQYAGDKGIKVDTLLLAFEEALADADREIEAFVRQRALNEWIKNSGLVLAEQYGALKGERGRPSKKWDPVLEALVITLVGQLKANGLSLSKHSDLAQSLNEMAKRRHPERPIPSANTIEKNIAKLVKGL